MHEFTICAAQSHAFAGRVVENVTHHATLVRLAVSHGAQVVIFPELSLTGYERALAADWAIDAHDPRLEPLQALADANDITIVAGCPLRSLEAKPFIAALVFRSGQPRVSYRKRFLHAGEEQYFLSSAEVGICESHEKKIGIAICADINHSQHADDVALHGAAIYAAGVAMTPNGIGEAERAMAAYACRHRFLAVMANYASPTGGYPMAGRSAMWDDSGRLVARAEAQGESLVLATASDVGWRGSVLNCNAAT